MGQLIDYGETIKDLNACKERLEVEKKIVETEQNAFQIEVKMLREQIAVQKEIIQTVKDQTALEKEQKEFFKKAYDSCKRKPSWKCKLFSIIFTLGMKQCN